MDKRGSEGGGEEGRNQDRREEGQAKCQSTRQRGSGIIIRCQLAEGHKDPHWNISTNYRWKDSGVCLECGVEEGSIHAGYCSKFGDITDRTPPVIPTVVPGGASRDPHPERAPANWFSVDYESVRAIAETAYEGDKRYGINNWRKGLPASNLINHALEHIFLMLEGNTSEPHLEHAIWNLGKLRWMARNAPELIDVPMIRRALGLPAEVMK